MTNSLYLQRCVQLARLGAGYTAPNPMVGAVLVYNDRIIGEGWHRQYGGPHAEVNCINAVSEPDKQFIPKSVLYVSLEPCTHFGKTAPCTDLVIREQIPQVVIGCPDPFKEVNGKGIEKLLAAGVKVELAEGIPALECKNSNKRFFTFHIKQRPYIILKWAETEDGKIAASLNPPPAGGGTSGPAVRRLLISNEYSNRLVHQWRSEEAAILVGTNTALSDDPELTTRLWPGPSPVRLVIDRELRLPKTLKLFNGHQPTIVFNSHLHSLEEGITAETLKKNGGVWYHKMQRSLSPLREITDALYRLNIQSLLVEGGAKLLQSFIDDGLWDEVRTITGPFLQPVGLAAPVLSTAVKTGEYMLSTDKIEILHPGEAVAPAALS